eukprot:g5060.t1
MGRIPSTYEYDSALKVFVANTASHEEHKRGRVIDPDAIRAMQSTTTVKEPSEEIRLKLCRFVRAIHGAALKRDALALVLPYFHDITIFVQAMLRDPYAAAKREACGLLKTLMTTQPDAAKHYAVAFVKSLIPVLQHRHARVRLDALDALASTVSCEDRSKRKGAGTEAINNLLGHQDANVIPVAAFYGKALARTNTIAKLTTDKVQSVRMRLTNVLGDWLLHLPDRYDHRGRLLPYLLSSLRDPSDAVKKRALEIFDEIGRQHEKENAEEVIEKRQYGVDGAKTSNFSKPLPHPFERRPRLGTRMYVRGLVPRFLKPLLGELQSWQDEPKKNAASMLRVVLVFMEEHITMELRELLRSLRKSASAISRGDGDCAISQCAELVGRYVVPSAYIPLLLPHVLGDTTVDPSANTKTRCQALAVLRKMCEGTLSYVLLPHVVDGIEALESVQRTYETEMPSELRLELLRTLNVFANVLLCASGGAENRRSPSGGGKTEALKAIQKARREGNSADLVKIGAVEEIQLVDSIFKLLAARDVHVGDEHDSWRSLLASHWVTIALSEITFASGKKLSEASTSWHPSGRRQILLRQYISELSSDVARHANQILPYLQRLLDPNIFEKDTARSARSYVVEVLRSLPGLFETADGDSSLSSTTFDHIARVFESILDIASSVDVVKDPAEARDLLDCISKMQRCATRGNADKFVSKVVHALTRLVRCCQRDAPSPDARRCCARCLVDQIAIDSRSFSSDGVNMLSQFLDDSQDEIRRLALAGLRAALTQPSSEDTWRAAVHIVVRRTWTEGSALSGFATDLFDILEHASSSNSALCTLILCELAKEIESNATASKLHFKRLVAHCQSIVSSAPSTTSVSTTTTEVSANESLNVDCVVSKAAEVSERSAADEKSIGDASFKAKQYGKAVEYYSRSLDKDPHAVSTRLNRVAALLRMDEFERANLDCLVCLASSTCTDAHRVKALFRRSRAQIGLSNREEALRLLEEARALSPESAQIAKCLRGLKREEGD